MKALVKKYPKQGIVLEDVPPPEVGDNDVLIKVNAVGICGTDLHIYTWDEWSRRRIKPPVIIGHEFVGEVAATGRSVNHVRVGERVSAEGHITCGVCEFCRTGQGHICHDVEIIGVDRDGCFAEYIAIDARNLWPVPDAIPNHIAALFDPIGNAMHTVMAESVEGKSVFITGAGAIGLFAAAIAKSLGAYPIIVVEPNVFKRELSRLVGADIVFDPSENGIETTVLGHTSGLGPHLVFEMSGHPEAVRLGFRLVRNGGCVNLLGIPSGEITLDLARDVIFKGITIRAITGRQMFTTWYQSQAFMLRNQDAINRIITHRLPFEEYERGFALLRSGDAAKVVLELP